MTKEKVHDGVHMPYKESGDILTSRMDPEKGLAYYANALGVSLTAVHLWISGKTRPRAHRY